MRQSLFVLVVVFAALSTSLGAVAVSVADGPARVFTAVAAVLLVLVAGLLLAIALKSGGDRDAR